MVGRDTPEPIRSGRLCKSSHGAGRSQRTENPPALAVGSVNPRPRSPDSRWLPAMLPRRIPCSRWLPPIARTSQNSGDSPACCPEHRPLPRGWSPSGL
nr:MAG TPA: hypothetical protein [Caudoviricetes sp.]